MRRIFLIFSLFCFISTLANARKATRRRTFSCYLPKIRYGTPKVHGVNAPRNNAVRPGTLISLECEQGFKATQPNTSVCLVNGRWSNLLGRCTPHFAAIGGCELPNPGRYGHLDTRGSRFILLNETAVRILGAATAPNMVAQGSVVRITCDYDFDFTLAFGANQSTCLANATWSDQLGVCLPSRVRK